MNNNASHNLQVLWDQIYIIIRYWMVGSLCSFAIETTFPLSNFKTKHIFGILMARVKFLKPFGAPLAPQFLFIFFIAVEGGGKFFFSVFTFTAVEGVGFPNGRWR